jgi:outer membrane protein assembly factor BamA
LYDLDSTGMLIKGDIPGSQGGTVSGFGAVALFDSRDDVFYPSKGWYSEIVAFRSDQTFGSDFNYTRIAFDLSYYTHLRENIFAFNVYSVYSDTDLPFFQMANLGGSKKMRGFYEGRYRDNNLLVLQAEYRRHLFWLLGFTVFADIGQVANRYDAFQMNHWRYTYGAGLRLGLDKIHKINLRLDVAVGDGKVLPYFTIGEAF